MRVTSAVYVPCFSQDASTVSGSAVCAISLVIPGCLLHPIRDLFTAFVVIGGLRAIKTLRLHPATVGRSKVGIESPVLEPKAVDFLAASLRHPRSIEDLRRRFRRRDSITSRQHLDRAPDNVEEWPGCWETHLL